MPATARPTAPESPTSGMLKEAGLTATIAAVLVLLLVGLEGFSYADVAAALDVPISIWLYICTGLGALFIALSKRRSELEAAGDAAGQQRETLQRYTRPLLDQFIAIVAPSTLVAYTLYTFTAPNLPENHTMMLTIPFVVYGLFRYMFLVHTHNMGENPEDILITDVPLIACIALWLVTATAVLIVWG